MKPEQQPEGFFSISRVSPEITFEDFFEQYYLQEQPVIIEGLGKDYPAVRRWNSDYLVNALSREGTARATALWYWLDLGTLQDDYQTPGIISGLYNSGRVFHRTLQGMRIWVHRKGHVSSWHYDNNMVNVFNLQVVGRKEWLLVSPQNPLTCYPFTSFAIVGKQDEQVCSGRVHTRFMLNEGDMLYLPPLWFHKVYALDEENISLNWVMTNRETKVTSVGFKRDLERYKFQYYMATHRFRPVQKLLSLIHDNVNDYLQYRWRYDHMIKSSYHPGFYRISLRVLKEFSAFFNMLLVPVKTYRIMGKVDPVKPLKQ